MKNMSNKLWSIWALVATVIILGQQAQALELTEIMYNPPGTDAGREWVEIYAEDGANLAGIRFYGRNGNHIINLANGSWILAPGEYAIITNGAANFMQEYPFYEGTLYYASFSLSNQGEEIGLYNTSNGEVIDFVQYEVEYANGNNRTLEKINGAWVESLVEGGTPGYLSDYSIPEFSVLAAMLVITLGIAGLGILRKRN